MPTDEEPSKQAERAKRILDTTAELLLRWGYRKTTIDDIARQAGVAKGTIYLHWKTREDLFYSLIIHEWVASAEVAFIRIRAEPDGVLLHNMVRHVVYTIMNRPLIKSLFIQNTEIWGDLLERFSTSASPDSPSPTQIRINTATTILEFQRNRGLIRTNSSLPEQLHQISAIIFGFITIDQYLPAELQLSPAAIADQTTETLKRTFATDEPISPQTLQEVRAYFRKIYGAYLQQIYGLYLKRLNPPD